MEATMEEMILASWQRLAQAKEDVDLLSMYKGMPVIFRVKVNFVYEGAVHVLVESYKSICLTLDTKVIALSDMLDEPVHAQAQSVDFKGGKAVLKNFSYVGTHLGDRMSPRVEPRDPIEVMVESGGRKYLGELLDLSISGAGVFVTGEGVNKLRPRSVTRFKLPLPNETLDLLGVVRHSKRTTQGNRLGISFEPGTNLHSVFAYINQRRGELLKELDALYQAEIR